MNQYIDNDDIDGDWDEYNEKDYLDISHDKDITYFDFYYDEKINNRFYNDNRDDNSEFDFSQALIPEIGKRIKFGEHFNYSIDSLPDYVEELYFTDACSFTTKINKYPKSLIKITLCGNFKFINSLPESIKFLAIYKADYSNLGMHNLPLNLLVLYIYRSKIDPETYYNLPLSLQILKIDNDVFNTLKELSEVIDLSCLPSNLNKLIIISTDYTFLLNNLPDSLETIYLYCVANIHNLPKKLKVLEINLANPYHNEIINRFPNHNIILDNLF